ncbi:unnamed protein product [Eruca vesicaria subsp. sativa]|uniref:Uncharacterized protein n=1 Tax=Eruca vesicaria subsp. sativa TaxID=29727 RepID=A0ABC8L5J8_ERUVS|nr:unnamed protein product [Eruca vesicaria subsp. sativa]
MDLKLEANKEHKQLVGEDDECWKNVDNKKSPEDMLNEIQMQKTHELYCSKCFHNITKTAKLFKKKREASSPYNEDKFIWWFVIVFSFKYPFIYLPWLYNNTPGDVTDIKGRLKPQHVSDVDDIPVPPSPPLLLPKSHTDKTLISAPNFPAEDVSKIQGNLKPQDPDIVEDDKPVLPPIKNKGDVTAIKGRLKPQHVSDVDDIHVPPSLPPLLPQPHTNVSEIQGNLKSHGSDVSPPIKNKGGCWVPLDKDFPSNIVLFLISLLLSLAILALCWSFISRTKGKKSESVANLPNMEILQNGEAQISTRKPGLSTPGNKTNGRSDTETKISPPFLWKHIVVLVQIVLQTELDILKSIVYGGLIESITSFGVVSSASASGTSTLHVISLGLANLFSGLCIIIYNLYGLVTSKPIYPYAKIGHMTDEKATDPYEELLGNRNNVILHCIVVVVSFIFFGVIPPLLYRFSYKITDNGRHYEAAIVIAASLVCVTSLSFAKAYAFGMDKIKTVAVYTGIAIGGSALSLIATQYVRDLLEMNEFLKLASDYP